MNCQNYNNVKEKMFVSYEQFYFMNYINEFKYLLPEELEVIKSLLDSIIIDVKKSKNTNIKYQKKHKAIECSNCGNNCLVKNGTKNDIQYYKCKKCNKFFSVSTNTIISGIRLNYTQLINFMLCLINYNTLSETSKIVGISERETYNLRIKIISTLNKYEFKNLHGVVQCDERYIRLSFKGTRKNNMPRKSRRNGFEDRTSGISMDQVCILMAIDEEDNIFIKIVGLGPLSTKDLEDNFYDYIEEESIFITDSKSSYIQFAKKKKIILKQISDEKHKTKDGYHLGELNSLMSELDVMLLKTRGLSTRHLQEYLDLFRFRKILKYTVEYLKQKKKLYNYVLIQFSNLKNKEVCKKAMPVDVSENNNMLFR